MNATLYSCLFLCRAPCPLPCAWRFGWVNAVSCHNTPFGCARALAYEFLRWENVVFRLCCGPATPPLFEGPKPPVTVKELNALLESAIVADLHDPNLTVYDICSRHKVGNNRIAAIAEKHGLTRKRGRVPGRALTTNTTSTL